MRSDDAALLVVGDALALVVATVTVALPEVPLLVVGVLVAGTEAVVLDGLPLDALDTTVDKTLGVETPMTDLVVVSELTL